MADEAIFYNDTQPECIQVLSTLIRLEEAGLHVYSRKLGEQPTKKDEYLGKAEYMNVLLRLNAYDGKVSGQIYNVELQTRGDTIGKYYFMNETKDWGTLIDTDYDNYSIRYSCTNLSENLKEEHADIWVRNPDIEESLL